MPQFSVIIPTYNRRGLLAAALESVFGQTFTNYELIVVDDGSSDGTWESLQALAGRVRPFWQENAGPGAARNLGLAHARGDYVAFLDSDDLWFPWTLSVFARLVAENASPSILGAKVFQFRQDAQLATIREEPPRGERFADYYASTSNNYILGATMAIIRRDQLLQIGNFTEKRINAEDHDLMMRIGIAPGFVRVLCPYTLGYRRHGVSETSGVRNSYRGVEYLLDQEASGAYPGGVARLKRRREILTLHVRPVALAALKSGLRWEAWALYRKTFVWHVRQGRWKFLFGFPLLGLLHFCARRV